MREILFRGKRADNGEWVDGDLMHHYGGWVVAIGDYYEAFEVIPKTIGQYTGLCDKNGKKIFEGDIVKYSNDKYKFVVCFGKHDISCCGCCYYSHQTIGFFLRCDNLSEVKADEEAWEALEVIGNIHDNSELLKEVSE